MSELRDKCWIRKLYTDKIQSYFIPESENYTLRETISREIPELIENAKETCEEKADLVFEKFYEKTLGDEGYRLEKKDKTFYIGGNTERAWLYGLYELYRILALKEEWKLPAISKPGQNIRMINHWDNFDGSIERGYAGESIFFSGNDFRRDYGLIREYARLLASVGINAVSINNVNVHSQEMYLLERDRLSEIKKLTDIFYAYGIKLFLSVNFASPIHMGKIDTADPLSVDVQNWWRKKFAEVYQIIPQFGGIVVKADSEGEPGPFTYGRNHDDGANMLARAIKPFGGIVIWRCFVYNCRQQWWDRNTDRAKAAYDIFSGLDGKFEDNVILQIKNGPIDFQIREPVSPLFGKLKKTNQILEVQITQEYTGHQIDICYLVPMWKEVLDYDTCHGENAQVKNILKKNSLLSQYSGFAAVGNVGMDTNWTGNKLAQANLYGFGRLGWDNELTSERIAEEWIVLSLDLSEKNRESLKEILITSRETYEMYTCPLAVGFMCVPGLHYGVDVDGYEYSPWGTYHYADRNGIGRERSEKTGTGYTRQYAQKRYEEYEALETCPDELLLFFHHVPYTHVLHSGKTVIQHIYDTHFEGVLRTKEYLKKWKDMKDEIPFEVYENVSLRLKHQMENAENWKNQINTYFYRKSGIQDQGCREIYK